MKSENPKWKSVDSFFATTAKRSDTTGGITQEPISTENLSESERNKDAAQFSAAAESSSKMLSLSHLTQIFLDLQDSQLNLTEVRMQ